LFSTLAKALFNKQINNEHKKLKQSNKSIYLFT
jgi:hypothetical protein